MNKKLQLSWQLIFFNKTMKEIIEEYLYRADRKEII
jgi:hypothetical protein